MKFLSEQKNRAIFEDVEHIRVLIIGDAKTEVVRQATDEDRQRWAPQYAAFKDKGEQLKIGTPLEQWGVLPGSHVRMFNANNVFTVEQLAVVNEGQFGSLGLGAREWVQKAKAFIEQANDSAHAEHLAAQLQRSEDDNIQLKGQLAALSQQVADMQSQMNIHLQTETPPPAAVDQVDKTAASMAKLQEEEAKIPKETNDV